jgi:uncharacterized membrane protein
MVFAPAAHVSAGETSRRGGRYRRETHAVRTAMRLALTAFGLMASSSNKGHAAETLKRRPPPPEQQDPARPFATHADTLADR